MRLVAFEPQRLLALCLGQIEHSGNMCSKRNSKSLSCQKEHSVEQSDLGFVIPRLKNLLWSKPLSRAQP